MLRIREPNVYKGNGWKFKTGCLGYKAEQHFDLNFARPKDASLSRRGDHVAVAEDWYEPMGKTIFEKVSVLLCRVFVFVFAFKP